MLPNIPQFALTMEGILRAGNTCVDVNPLYTARELEHQLNDSGATAIVILENFAATLAEVVERTPIKHIVMASMGHLRCLTHLWETTSYTAFQLYSRGRIAIRR